MTFPFPFLFTGVEGATGSSANRTSSRQSPFDRGEPIPTELIRLLRESNFEIGGEAIVQNSDDNGATISFAPGSSMALFADYMGMERVQNMLLSEGPDGIRIEPLQVRSSCSPSPPPPHPAHQHAADEANQQRRNHSDQSNSNYNNIAGGGSSPQSATLDRTSTLPTGVMSPGNSSSIYPNGENLYPNDSAIDSQEEEQHDQARDSEDGNISEMEANRHHLGPEITHVVLVVGEETYRINQGRLREQSGFFHDLFDPSNPPPHSAQLNIDRDGKLFQHIMRFLRSNHFPLFIHPQLGFNYSLYGQLLSEAEFFRIPLLTWYIKKNLYEKAFTFTYSLKHLDLKETKKKTLTQVPAGVEVSILGNGNVLALKKPELNPNYLCYSLIKNTPEYDAYLNGDDRD